MNMTNKVALITGGSKGIGRATAIALARAGADVAISARSEDQLKEVEKLGRKALIFVGDMRIDAEIKAFALAALKQFGRIDILVNNAGVGYFHKVEQMPVNDWDTMFDLNVRAAFLLTQECLPYLRQAGESVVVNVVSLAGKNAFPGGAGYAATKHALLAFSRCLMLEERSNGVRVLAICPGSVDTHFFDTHPEGMNPANRDVILRSEDVADSILHMIHLPQRATVSEIDIRPSNPKG